MSQVEIPGWLSILAMVLGSGAVVWMVRGYWTNRLKSTDAPSDFRQDYRALLQDERKARQDERMALQDERKALLDSRAAEAKCGERLDKVEGELAEARQEHLECIARTKALEGQVAELQTVTLQAYTAANPGAPPPKLSSTSGQDFKAVTPEDARGGVTEVVDARIRKG